MSNSGLSKCRKCGLSLIEEESASHICQKKDAAYKFTEDGCFMFFDGFQWHRHRLSAETLQGDDWEVVRRGLDRTPRDH